MEGQDNDVMEVRVSGRSNKGKPPPRFGHEEISVSKVHPPKSTTSNASSARRRSQAEAERDVKTANLKKQYAVKLMDSKKLQIQIDATQVKLDKAKETWQATLTPESENIYDKLSEELDQLKVNKSLVDVELESMEMSLQDELQAIKSTCQAELDQIDEDEVAVSDEGNPEDIQVMTVTWAEEQAKLADKAAAADQFEEFRYDVGVEKQRATGDRRTDSYIDNMNDKVWPTTSNKESGDHFSKPKTYYSSANEIQHNKYPWNEDHDGARQAYQRHRKKNPSTAYFDSSSDEDIGAAGLQRSPSSKEVTMHDLVNALNNFGSNSQRSNEIVMKTTIDKDLPKFGGEPEQWVQFKSEFDRTTKKLKIDNSENMIRLRKSLVGQAKATVQHLMVNINNVDTIMESLEKRFGRPRVVLNALAAKAKDCGYVTIAKPDSIIEFGLAIQALVANVKSFKADGYLHSTELLETLVKKLSPDLATRWYEWLSADQTREDNLVGLEKWSSIQLDIAYQRSDWKIEDRREERGERRRRGQGAVNVVTTEEGKCSYCKKGNYGLEKCWAFQKKNLDERWNFVKSIKACICCLGQGHRARECKAGSKCDVNGCHRYHHRLLHNEKGSAFDGDEMKKNIPPPFTPFNDDEKSPVKLLGNFAVIVGCDGPLPIVPIKLSGPNGTVKCHALLDTGASRSLIKMSIAEKIGLKGVPTEYSYKGITGEKKIEKNAMLVSCDVSGTIRGSNYNKLRSAITVEEIRMNPFSMNTDEIKRKWPHLKNVAASNLLRVVPDVVIGNNNPRLILARKLVLGADDEPVGWRSELGWAISGNFDNDGTGIINSMYGARVSNDELHALIKKSFSLEDFGVKPSATKGKNLDEKRAYAILESTTNKVGDRWEVGLLWREDNPQFPASEFTALKRLQYMEKKMGNPDFKKLYLAKMQEYLTKGYMKKLTPEEAAVRKPSTYTIPHFGVTNPNKPGKLRLVLDAKAKCHGVSLNDKLLKGPDLIRSLVGVLWNFRKHRIALTGDISDMFHRVMIREEDRDSQRLLWREHPNAPVDTFQMQVMIFGATSSPSSAIYVKDENARQFIEKYPTAATATIHHFYVDDCLSGGDSEEDVVNLRKQLCEINAAGNFNLCKFMSNSMAVLDSIPEDLRADGIKNFEDKDDLPGERVLGMWWNSHDDAFQFKLGLHKVESRILGGDIPTKREMCRLIMSLFDPLGLICHYKIKALILQQEVWSAGVDWDNEIPFSTFLKWRKWLARLVEVKDVKLPRCYSHFLNCAEDIQMHIFNDASSEAYCCIIFLRIKYNNKVEIVFVAAKARVAPIKKSTMPKLELQAALMGSRLAASVQEEVNLKINRRYFWSDSSTVLQWLCSRAGNLKEFVANRIGEIQELTNLDEWNWIPTKLNIADVGTRFESEIGFSPNNEWYQGPQFLRQDPDTWNFSEDRKRMQKEGSIAVSIASEQVFKQAPITNVSCNKMVIVPEPSRFSSFIRLVRATAAVREAANYWLCRSRKEESSPPWSYLPVDGKNVKFSSNLSAVSILKAEKDIIGLSQRQSFEEDLDTLRDGGQLKRKGKLWKLSPFIDQDGLMRVDGRINAARAISEDTKNPIILPPRHRITELIVDAEHVRCAHQGVETVLNNLRQRFWIVDGRHTVKRSWIRCVVCHLARVKPVNPKMGSLPEFRLTSNQPPFTFAGIDLFGPMHVTVGRRHEKRWGVLICCMVTRAVHLEVVHSLETDEVLMALSRFIDVRGRPARIHSDNGTNFVGAARELREQWSKINFAQIQQHGKFHKIEWTFNPPAAPHMGGVWERLIQIVKKCIHATLKEVYPKDTTLLTVFKSAENIVNSRPLTHVSSDPHDPVPITPNDILRGGCDTGPSLPAVMDSSDKCLREKWKRSQILADQFWRRWTSDYLPKLIRREKWQEPSEPMKIGDLVFVVDENLPRNCWIRGVVSQVFPGKDGQVRQVEVTTKWNTNSKKENKLRRPVAKLCPLGLNMEIKGSEDP